jgi:hypothetical protein
VLLLPAAAGAVPKGVAAPRIDGPWWQVAGNPMDHKYATDKQEPVDFAVWQAAPEIILHEGQYYIAALNEDALNGIRIAKLRWVKG